MREIRFQSGILMQVTTNEEVVAFLCTACLSVFEQTGFRQNSPAVTSQLENLKIWKSPL